MPEENEYILRKDALAWTNQDEWGTPDERWRPESEFGAMIKVLPSADVRENVHAKWDKSGAFPVCTACGAGFHLPFEFDFCYHCGAIMDA